jgi:purine-cytosine permease-like protein
MGLNRGQRTVGVIALGVAIYFGWSALDTATAGGPGGWVNHSPNAGVIYSSTPSALQTNTGLRLLVQLIFVAAWALGSLWLLRNRRELDARRRSREAPFEGLGPVDDELDRS